jgi:hypothetical protein
LFFKKFKIYIIFFFIERKNILGGFNMVEKEVEYKEMIKSVASQLERSNFGAYIDLMQSPGRMIALNFFAGIARGFGVAMGFTILGALLIYILQRLVVLNLPIIGGIITEVVKLVQLNVR